MCSNTQQKLPCYSDIFLFHIDAFQITCIITEFLCVEITYTIVIFTYKCHKAGMVWEVT